MIAPRVDYKSTCRVRFIDAADRTLRVFQMADDLKHASSLHSLRQCMVQFLSLLLLIKVYMK